MIGRYGLAFLGILGREWLRFVRQRGRFFAALVRPLLWLVIFAAGFRTVLGLPPTPPYETSISYEQYIVPGLLGMILLFNGMQAALSMVYDRETGSMKVLLTSPFPRPFLLVARLVATTLVLLPQVYAFLAIAWFWDVRPPPIGMLSALPALFLSGMMLSALGLLLSSLIKQLENFAGVMNFVIFPMLFASSALYPLRRLEEASPILYAIAAANPFTHAVELIRFALYAQLNMVALGWVVTALVVCLVLALYRYEPSRSLRSRRLEP